jgi:hypothetical protein
VVNMGTSNGKSSYEIIFTCGMTFVGGTARCTLSEMGFPGFGRDISVSVSNSFQCEMLGHVSTLCRLN